VKTNTIVAPICNPCRPALGRSSTNMAPRTSSQHPRPRGRAAAGCSGTFFLQERTKINRGLKINETNRVCVDRRKNTHVARAKTDGVLGRPLGGANAAGRRATWTRHSGVNLAHAERYRRKSAHSTHGAVSWRFLAPESRLSCCPA